MGTQLLNSLPGTAVGTQNKSGSEQKRTGMGRCLYRGLNLPIIPDKVQKICRFIGFLRLFFWGGGFAFYKSQEGVDPGQSFP